MKVKFLTPYILIFFLAVFFLSVYALHLISRQYQPYLAGESLPLNFPDIEINIEGDLGGKLYFDVGNVAQTTGNYVIELDRDTSEITFAKQAESFGVYMHREGDVLAYYDYPLSIWKGQRRLEPDVGLMYTTGGYYQLYSANYEHIGTIADTRGIDSHELEILDNGNYVYFIEDRRALPPDATRTCLPYCEMFGQTILEVTPQGETVFSWALLDHYEYAAFDMNDMFFSHPTMLYDVTHANSIDIRDNQWLISVRHTNQVINLNRASGEILWKLGGIDSDFAFVNDEFNGISHQHTPVWVDANHVLIFDNGNERMSSRAAEYQLDYENMTATLIWEHRQGFSPNRGSVQRLPNGNTLINFVQQQPNIIEVTPSGEIVYSISLPQNFASYQVQWSE